MECENAQTPPPLFFVGGSYSSFLKVYQNLYNFTNFCIDFCHDTPGMKRFVACFVLSWFYYPPPPPIWAYIKFLVCASSLNKPCALLLSWERSFDQPGRRFSYGNAYLRFHTAIQQLRFSALAHARAVGDGWRWRGQCRPWKPNFCSQQQKPKHLRSKKKAPTSPMLDQYILHKKKNTNNIQYTLPMFAVDCMILSLRVNTIT